jgi:two-component system sensor histidine kinase AlgZ
MELARNYLSIEQIRFGIRLQVENSLAEECRHYSFLPLLLQPLLENAVNHGISHLLEGGRIKLEAHGEGSQLKIVIGNPCDPDRPKSNRTGYGLSLVRRRLEEYYGAQAWMHCEDRGTFFQVKMTVPAVLHSTVN